MANSGPKKRRGVITTNEPTALSACNLYAPQFRAPGDPPGYDGRAPVSWLVPVAIDVDGGTRRMLWPSHWNLPETIQASFDGDWRTGRDLLRQFVSDRGGRHPLLIEYVASRLRAWVDSDFAPEKATRAFLAHPPRGADVDPELDDRHVRIVMAYLVLRERGVDRDSAIDRAGESEGEGFDTAKRLVNGLHGGSKAGFTSIQRRAIRSIERGEPDSGEFHTPRKIGDQDYLRRCLSDRGMKAWCTERARIETLLTATRKGN